MDNIFILILIGFAIGTLGTLIGAGGGFILVPFLIFFYPNLTPEQITAVSLAIVFFNALSGSFAYARAQRVDYKAGLLFFAFTVPGSILGVFITKYISAKIFTLVFGIMLVLLSVFLFFRKNKNASTDAPNKPVGNGKTHHTLTDSGGEVYDYYYNTYTGCIISFFVGFISPVLGIGGGIIHVPALVSWLNFPVRIATATSHFILAAMSLVSVIVHLTQGNYNSPQIIKLVLAIGAGVMVGAQLGAYFSHKVKATFIVKALAIALAVVGIRLLAEYWQR